MLTFDRLKIVSYISNIDIIHEDKFEKVIKNGCVISMKYHKDDLYLLDIKIDYEEKEVVIEFTGRILGKDYPKLISIETITKCIETINEMGFCHLDIDGLMDSDVVKCDVTKDISLDDVSKLSTFIRNHNNNYKKILCRVMKNGNMAIEKNVTSRKCKKRMIIYDKGKEMHLADNKPFVEEYGLEDAFNGKCRFELNLNSKEQIRTSMGINNTKLRTVLTSESNPIMDFLNDVVQSPSEQTIVPMDMKTYTNMLILKDCDYDLEKVEARLREYYKCKGTNFKNKMEPFRQLVEKDEGVMGSDYWCKIKGQLV